MFATNSSIPELLQLDAVRDMLRVPGPCITILLPPYHPGEPAGSPAARLKANVQEAGRQLAERALSPSATANLLEPLERLTADRELLAGTQGSRLIFRSPNVFEQFRLTQPVVAALNVGGSFAIRRILGDLTRSPVLYVLAVSKAKVSLFRGAGLQIEATPLPHGVPETLAEALAFDPPDHDLENRSAAGSSVGSMRRVRFGTGSGREQEHGHLADYYKLVDRGLQEMFKEQAIPLLLAGVEVDAAQYRAVSTYRYLASKCLPGGPDAVRTQPEMLQHAYSILRSEEVDHQGKALKAAIERTAPSRFSNDTDIILRAAFEGRISYLYLDENAETIDLFEGANYQSWGREDLLNLAAIQTLLHHGKVCELPTRMMPEASAAVGLMRF